MTVEVLKLVRYNGWSCRHAGVEAETCRSVNLTHLTCLGIVRNSTAMRLLVLCISTEAAPNVEQFGHLQTSTACTFTYLGKT